jgi:hypothetical protein
LSSKFESSESLKLALDSVDTEKDQDIRIKHDRFEWVGHNRHLVVKQDKFEHVEHNSHSLIDTDQFKNIKRDHHLSVGGKQAISVDASYSLTVGNDVIEKYKANHNEQTTGDYYLKAQGIVIEATSGITPEVWWQQHRHRSIRRHDQGRARHSGWRHGEDRLGTWGTADDGFSKNSVHASCT